MTGVSRVPWLAPWMLLSIGLAASVPSHDGTARFLASVFDITPSDLGHLNAGRVVSRTLPAKDSREMAVFGAVKIKIPAEYYVQQFSDIARFKRDEAIAQIGAFSDPPHLRNIEALTLDEADLSALASCRVGDCKLQLPAEAIGRFKKEIDWRRADSGQHATGLLRQLLVDYVAEYQRVGPKAAMQYADTSKVVDLEREFTSLLDSTPGTWQQFPALRRHLTVYPDGREDGTTDLMYWSKEKMGRKLVLSLTHVAIVPAAAGSPAAFAIASKHLYGSHYLDASLGLTVLVRDAASPAPAIYLVYVNRSRVDVFGGMFGGLVRKIVASRARQTMDDQLGRLQRRMEAQYTAHQTS